MPGRDALEVPGGSGEPGKELLERSYIDEEDYSGLREIETRREWLFEVDSPAKYHVWVYLRR